MQAIKTLQFYLHNFYWQDIALLIGCVLGFFVILIIAIFLKKHQLFAMFLILANVCIMPFVFIHYEGVLADKLRPHTLKVESGKRLKFSTNIYFSVKLRNDSKKDFKICRVYVSLQKPSHNRLLEIIRKLRPIRSYTLTYADIEAGEEISKDLVLPLHSKSAFNIHSSSVCF